MRGLRRGGKSREKKGNNSLKSRSYSCCILMVYRCFTMVQKERVIERRGGTRTASEGDRGEQRKGGRQGCESASTLSDIVQGTHFRVKVMEGGGSETQNFGSTSVHLLSHSSTALLSFQNVGLNARRSRLYIRRDRPLDSTRCSVTNQGEREAIGSS